MTIQPLSSYRPWPFLPDWRQSFRVIHEYKTEIIKSRSGKEQRRALRTTPRKTVEFRLLLTGDAYRSVKRFLTASQSKPVVMPELTRSAVTAAPIASGVYVVPLVAIPGWMAAGMRIIIQTKINPYTVTQSFHEIVGVDQVTKQITLSTPVAATWAAGAKVHPALMGLLNAELSSASTTSTVGTVAVKFMVDPGSEPYEPATTATTTFGGREVFTTKPDWRGGADTAYSHEVERIDYSRGVIETLMPIAYGTTTRRNEFLSLNRPNTEELLAQFRRSKGQRGEFWAESGEPDIVIKGSAAAGTYDITASGDEVYQTFLEDTVHKALYFKMTNGAQYRATVSQVLLNQNGDSVLRLATTLPEAMSDLLVVRVAWLRVVRHGTDTLTFDWLTDQVSRTQMTFRSLEVLPTEVRA